MLTLVQQKCDDCTVIEQRQVVELLFTYREYTNDSIVYIFGRVLAFNFTQTVYIGQWQC